MNKYLSLFFIVFFYAGITSAQDQHLIDSLETALRNFNAEKKEINKSSNDAIDSAKAKILIDISIAYWGNNPEKAMDYAKQGLAVSESIGYKKGIGNAYNSLGVIYDERGEYLSALDFHQKSLKIRLEANNKKGIAASYNNIGIIYQYLGNNSEALRYHFLALKIKEEMGDKKGIANSYTNIGVLYNSMNNYKEALKYNLAALKISEEIKNKTSIALYSNNIALTYFDLGDYPRALDYYFAALKLNDEEGNKKAKGNNLNNIGHAYSALNNYNEALKYHFEAIKIMEEVGDKKSMASCWNKIGIIYSKQKKYTLAEEYLDKALVYAKEIGALEHIRESYGGLAMADSAEGNFRQAMENYKLYIIYRDSLVNNENTKKIMQQQMQYDFDKKQVADSLQFAQEKEIAGIKLQKQKAYTYSGFAGVLVTILLLFFVYRNYNKQRIANQKLKEAQEQLIQSEKLAAFGTMATRMAHEIQNPLNFVNNFSEISKQLVDDIKNETATEKEKLEAINLLNGNLEKIYHHGTRASLIIEELQAHHRAGTALNFFQGDQN